MAHKAKQKDDLDFNTWDVERNGKKESKIKDSRRALLLVARNRKRTKKESKREREREFEAS